MGVFTPPEGPPPPPPIPPAANPPSMADSAVAMANARARSTARQANAGGQNGTNLTEPGLAGAVPTAQAALTGVK